MSRRATFLVCDEILFSLHGKLFPNGVYSADIGIPTSELIIPQLAFLFIIEMPIDDEATTILVRVELPDRVSSAQGSHPVAHPAHIEGRSTFLHKVPLLMPNPILTPGPIKGFVDFGDEEIVAGEQWITLTSARNALLEMIQAPPKKQKK